ncbi:putative insecticidal toxin complex [Pantoea sp. AS-PWVM4]|uniref:RHS repeat domain-containing protein n=1 Tax=Pantoea sp. AS-PWVM4 TaxID=1332069 RepID=UPI0003AC6A73|nr:RHS repeat-associated core domain-containing protein [Pantoea sp. AS-PWVM4]ERK09486.1 putative insecticidal toxin complex [Pantoea sp. AS-PWVM4]
MSQPHEFYRYAAPGERQAKYHHASYQQQVRYLPGVELRTGEQQHLLMIKAGSSHIWLEDSQKITHFNLADRLGSLSSVVDEQGVLVSRETWYPFGGTASWLTGMQSGATLKFRRYVNKERDATGLIFYNWRYYVPWAMRWLNSDPAGTVDGLNLFCMVGNNPVTLRDLDGRMANEEPLDLRINKAKDLPQQSVPDGVQPPIAVLNLTSDSLDPPPPVAVAALVTLESPKPGPSCDPVPMPTQKAFVKRCPTCRQVFKSQYLYTKHKNQENNTPIICSQCGIHVYHARDMNSHMHIHSEDKPHICQNDDCRQAFKRRFELAAHIKKHNPERKYICELCNKTFKNAGTLNGHRSRIHNNKQRFHCDLCPASFTMESKLGTHKLIVHQDCSLLK